jgi:hypothetical protein
MAEGIRSAKCAAFLQNPSRRTSGSAMAPHSRCRLHGTTVWKLTNRYRSDHAALVTRNSFSMKTTFLAVMTVIIVATFSIIQAPSQPPPSTVSAGRTSETATNPERPGGGHGLVWVNTQVGVYHREGSPFYGTTDKGKYMTEQDAVQAGYKRAPKTP